MPYIKQEIRRELDPGIKELIIKLRQQQWNAGCINYVCTRILWEYFRWDRSYTTINSIVGVLECVKTEFERRMVRQYEEEKITENGDISDTWWKD
jgi:broad-specificity NMP kinase